MTMVAKTHWWEGSQGARGAWHGDPELKARTVQKMRLHRERDELIHGEYQQLDPSAPSGYRGCALGCMVKRDEELSIESPLASASDTYARVAEDLGIPSEVAEAIDETFEGCLNFQDGADFAVAVVELLPVGADLRTYDSAELEAVTGRPAALLVWLAQRPIERSDAQATA